MSSEVQRLSNIVSILRELRLRLPELSCLLDNKFNISGGRIILKTNSVRLEVLDKKCHIQQGTKEVRVRG